MKKKCWVIGEGGSEPFRFLYFVSFYGSVDAAANSETNRRNYHVISKKRTNKIGSVGFLLMISSIKQIRIGELAINR